jgi:hypothetical protein
MCDRPPTYVSGRGFVADVSRLGTGDVTRALGRASDHLDAREAEWVSFGGQGYWRVRDGASRQLLIAADGSGEVWGYSRGGADRANRAVICCEASENRQYAANQ